MKQMANIFGAFLDLKCATVCRCFANNFLARKCKCGYVVGLPRAMETKHSKRGLLQKILLRSKASCFEGTEQFLTSILINLAFYEFGYTRAEFDNFLHLPKQMSDGTTFVS